MYQNYKIVVNTAAGRRRYMQWLIPYVLSSDIVDRYDLWVNTHNGADIAFFKELASTFPKVNLVWQPDGWVNGNASINAFYKQCIDDDTLYFKLDDDIIWMEDCAIEKMVKFRVENPQYLLVTPLVINNAQSTYLLQISEKIKLNKYYNSASDNEVLWRSGEFARQLHQWFLSKIEDGSYKELHVGPHPTALCRFSINSIMWFGKDLAKIGGIVPGDDEEYLSCTFPSLMGGSNCWNGDVLMAHFAFFTQREQLDGYSILEQYGEKNVNRFNSDETILKIHNRVQEVMNWVKENESQLIQQPSPYSYANPSNPDRTIKKKKSLLPPKLHLLYERLLKKKKEDTQNYIIG